MMFWLAACVGNTKEEKGLWLCDGCWFAFGKRGEKDAATSPGTWVFFSLFAKICATGAREWEATRLFFSFCEAERVEFSVTDFFFAVVWVNIEGGCFFPFVKCLTCCENDSGSGDWFFSRRRHEACRGDWFFSRVAKSVDCGNDSWPPGTNTKAAVVRKLWKGGGVFFFLFKLSKAKGEEKFSKAKEGEKAC